MQAPKESSRSKVKRLLLLRFNGVQPITDHFRRSLVRHELGRGGGVGRGLGVGAFLGVGVGLGVAVAVAVGVDVGVRLAVGVGVGVAVGVTVTVGVGVTVGVAVGVGVTAALVPLRRNTWSGAVCCNTAHVTLRIQTTQPVPNPSPVFCQAAPELA